MSCKFSMLNSDPNIFSFVVVIPNCQVSHLQSKKQIATCNHSQSIAACGNTFQYIPSCHTDRTHLQCNYNHTPIPWHRSIFHTAYPHAHKFHCLDLKYFEHINVIIWEKINWSPSEHGVGHWQSGPQGTSGVQVL